ncbi:hypothetical protein IAD21_01578 [Abditibacteriota bacterium]|nr:hypothetical protein IAD21_01578 [Abditibacteriota bacterium]
MKIVLSLLVLLCATPVFAVPLSVSVVNAKGAPVAGADVQFESFGKTPRGFVMQQTNEQGVTTFDAEPMPHSPFGDLAGRVFARKAGLAIGSGTLYFNKPPLSIELGDSAKIGGTVGDGEGKPIQGATISFLTVGERAHMLIEGPLLPQMTVHSGADGTWQLEGVPPGEQIYVTVSAPERVGKRTQILAGSTGETVLVPGAQIKGRVLGLDGKPLGGIYLSAQGTNNSRDAHGGNTKTGDDGTFTLDGLSSGTFNVMFYSEEEKPFVVPSFPGVNASVGAPIQLPDAHAVEGVMVGGHVLESDTKAPVAGVMIGVYGGLNPASSPQVSSTTTDENGAWKMRTVPGQSKIYLMGTPQEFKRDQQEKNLTIGEAGATDLDFNLEHLPEITGRLLDEKGQAIKATFTLSNDNQTFWASSDEKGNLTAYGPTNGEWKLSADGAWEVVGPARVTIANDKPLEVRLRRVQLATLELGIYDDDDAAIEGARIAVNVTTGEGDHRSMQTHELISDKMGRARYEGLRADQSVEIQDAKKSGYDTAPLPKIDHVGQLWNASVTLLKRSGRANGQVFAANGEVAPGVLVSASGIDARTDATGHFDLVPLPKGVIPVFAWQGNSFALGSNDKARLDLKSQTLEPTDPAKATTIINAIAEQAKDVEYYGRDSLIFEVGTFDQLALRLRQQPVKGAMATLLARFGYDKSVSPSRWFPVLQSPKEATQRLYDTSEWLKTGPTIEADEDARKFLQALQKDVAEAEPQFKSDDKWMIGHGIFSAAAIAEKIGDTQAADDLFERAHVFTEKAYGRESDRDYGIIGAIVAASPRLLMKSAALLPDTNSNRALMLAAGAPLLARSLGLEAVKPLLAQIQNAPPSKPDSYGDTFSTDSQWHEATIKSIRAAGKSNPALALELAKALPVTRDYSNYDARDTALCEAAFFQSPEVAQQLWRDSLPRLDAAKAMRFLTRILKRDEPFARAQYETLALNMDARPLPQYNANYWEPTTNVAAFAFYEARFNPARARFRLERAFASAKNQPGAGEALSSLAKAMAIFDSTRAIGWTASIPGAINDWGGSFSTRRRIAQWLVLSEAARQNASFSAPFSQDWDY